MRFYTAILFFFFFSPTFSFSQYYILGQDKARQKWYTIKTEHFRFIFPESYKDRAQYLANSSEKFYTPGTQTLDRSPKKIPVIIHTGTVVANAYSLWTPERAEFFMTPPQNSYAHNWTDQLVVHEYRHMIQMDKLNQGLTKVFSFLVGEQATAFTLGLFMPMWYMEGDAVSTETAFSHSGRGRMPSFEMIMRAQVLDKGLYNFEKAILGSFKDYVPDQYYFGYYYVAQSRRHFTDSLWSNAIDNSARNWWQISPISHSFKKQIGYNKKKLYEIYFRELRDEWLLQAAQTPTAKYANVPLAEKKVYTHYKFPKYLNDSTIIAEKSGMDEPAKFVSINIHSGEEKTVCRPGFYAPEELPALDVIPVLGKNSPGAWTTDNISLKNNKMVWAEKQIHPRWEYENYSVIMMHDFVSGKTRQITHKSKYFAPALSSDAKKIATVYYDAKGTCALSILDAESGEEIQQITVPKSLFLMTPVFGSNDETVYCVGMNPDLKSIYRFDLNNSTFTEIFGPVYGDINVPVYHNDSLYFNASFSGVENVYVMDLKSNNVFQALYDTYSSTNIDFTNDGKQFIFQSYTADGFSIKTGNTNEMVFTPLDSIRDGSIKLYEHYINQENYDAYFDSTFVDSLYEIKKYRRGWHLFNFHSWLPVSVNTDNNSLQPGVSIMSQNKLSTAITEIGYFENHNTGETRLYTTFSYLGWYPEVSIGISHGLNEVSLLTNEYVNLQSRLESRLNTTIAIPLKTTVRNYFQLYRLEAGFQISRFDINSFSSQIEYLNSLNGELSIYNRQKTVLKDLQPKFGQDFRATYKKSFGESLLGDEQVHVSATLFFPGLGPHHGTRIDLGWQKSNYNRFSFDDEIIYPRGYKEIIAMESFKVGLNYRFPFAYPDFNIGSLLYIKRFKANLFYDYGEIVPMCSGNRILRSTGAEISIDAHVFRFFIPLDIGLRISYLPVERDIYPEFLLGINFNGF